MYEYQVFQAQRINETIKVHNIPIIYAYTFCWDSININLFLAFISLPLDNIIDLIAREYRNRKKRINNLN